MKVIKKQQKNIGTHINRPLTNVSVAYMQDEMNFVASKVFPIIKSDKQSNIYFIYNRGDFFRDEMADRAAGTESAGTEYGIEASNPYYCRKKSLHYDITEEERANSDNPLAPDTDATELLTQKGLLNKETRWASSFFKTGVWGTDISGVAATPVLGTSVIKWSDDTNGDPLSDIDDYKIYMAQTTGKMPNTIVMSPDVWKTVKNHPVVLDRIKYTQRGMVSTDLMASMWDIEYVYVGWGVVNSSAKGVAESNNYILSSGSLLLMYVEKNPGLRKPSAGYTFAWTGMAGAGAYGNRMRKIPMPELGEGTERLEIDNAYDLKVIATDLGIFFSGLV